jgi:hypothetical protein
MSYEVAEIYNHSVDAGDLHELCKLSEQELRARFSYLSKCDQDLLWLNLQAQWLEDYTITSADPKAVSEVIGEAIHGGLEGWTEAQKMVIGAFLADIAKGARLWPQI